MRASCQASLSEKGTSGGGTGSGCLAQHMPILGTTGQSLDRLDLAMTLTFRSITLQGPRPAVARHVQRGLTELKVLLCA